MTGQQIGKVAAPGDLAVGETAGCRSLLNPELLSPNVLDLAVPLSADNALGRAAI